MVGWFVGWGVGGAIVAPNQWMEKKKKKTNYDRIPILLDMK